MQCSRCGAHSFDGSIYCGSCGARLGEAPAAQAVSIEQSEETLLVDASNVPPVGAGAPMPVEFAAAAVEAQVNPGAIPATPAPEPSIFVQPQAPVPSQPVLPTVQVANGEPEIPGRNGWAEFSGAPLPPGSSGAYLPQALPPGYPVPPGSSGVYPPQVLPPGYPVPPGSSGVYPPQALPPGYAMPFNYPPGAVPTFPSGVQPPLYMPPQMPAPAPARRWSPLILGIVVGVLVTLIFGGVIIGLRSSPTPNNQAAATAQPTTAVTPTATVMDGNLLYRQVTSQAPIIVDSLQDASQSAWGEITKPNYGCQIKPDGLHIYIKDADKFYYCTSGHGGFANFAFQVTAEMLSGYGGGIVFRANTTAGDLYFFHIFPDGRYEVNIESNHKSSAILAGGVASPSPISYRTKFSLAVIAQDNVFYLYFNQQLIKTFQDATYSSGYLGVVAEDINSPAETVYTNAQIWRI